MTFHVDSGSRDHADATLGTYLLGLESDGDRTAFRAHLDVCEPCRSEWQRLRELTPFLAKAADLQSRLSDLDDLPR